jgi:hypothetical protein
MCWRLSPLTDREAHIVPNSSLERWGKVNTGKIVSLMLLVLLIEVVIVNVNLIVGMIKVTVCFVIEICWTGTEVNGAGGRGTMYLYMSVQSTRQPTVLGTLDGSVSIMLGVPWERRTLKHAM